MYRLLIASLLIVLSASVVLAQDGTLFLRTAGDVDGKLHHTAAWLGGDDLDNIEIWVFNYDEPDLLDIEVGKIVPLEVGKDVQIYGGGYLTWWPATGDTFILPWLTLKGDVLGGQFKSNLSYYVPLSDGPQIFFSNDTGISWDVGHDIRVGPVVHWWHVRHQPFTPSWGLKASGKISDINLDVRYCPFGGGNDTIQVTACIPVSF